MPASPTLATGAVNTLQHQPLRRPDDELRFADRRDAGRRLAARLRRYRSAQPVIVGMARGGVPVAAEVARALEAPLDVVLVRKIGAPDNPEYAIGAVAEGGVRVLSDEALAATGIEAAAFDRLVEGVERDLVDQVRRYRAGRPPRPVAGRTVVLVDDGLATGRSARAAAMSLRRRGAARIVLAVPVGAPRSAAAMRGVVDDVVCVKQPDDLWAIGLWYDDFEPTSDHEVATLLAQQTCGGERTQARAVSVTAGGDVVLAGDLVVPDGARAVVAFAHGSGSSRLSPRNRAVAAALRQAGIATLLFDLLSPYEELERAKVFDIPLLAGRLVAATGWLRRQPETGELPLGYFGASTGAAAALVAAAEVGAAVGAVVARGGRPDLAGPHLGAVRAPTLLIVGGRDRQVLERNREAQRRLRCPNELAVVAGATHLFQEPGALEEVAGLAIDWFTRKLGEA